MGALGWLLRCSKAGPRETIPGFTDHRSPITVHRLPSSMIRKIVFYPAPVLRQVGARIETVTDEVRQLAADMIETMYDANGVGLAAPQVGESLQLAVVDVSHDEECVSYLRVNGEERKLADICPIVFINPSLELLGPKESENEGCLSFPDLRGEILRPRR